MLASITCNCCPFLLENKQCNSQQSEQYKKYTGLTNLIKRIMNRCNGKWTLALTVAFVTVVIYTWITYYHYYQLHEVIWFKKVRKESSNFDIVSFNLSKGVDWSSVKRRPKANPKKNELCKKWIVVTSVAHPTDQVKKLSKIKGWKLVVVADTKTPVNWK